MGTAFDFFDKSSWSESEAVTAQQQSNRALLRMLMTSTEFGRSERSGGISRWKMSRIRRHILIFRCVEAFRRDQCVGYLNCPFAVIA